jgi:hypothetical protein
MSSVQEIEDAVQRLSADERAAFRAWFVKFGGEEWDRQIEQDAQAGKLDWLIAEAKADREARACPPAPPPVLCRTKKETTRPSAPVTATPRARASWIRGSSAPTPHTSAVAAARSPSSRTSIAPSAARLSPVATARRRPCGTSQ